MKKILIPIDFSEISENAVRLAIDITSHISPEIFLVNFTEHPPGESFTATGEINKKYAEETTIFTISLIQKYQKLLAEWAAKYNGPNRTVEYQVYDARLKEGITSFVKENNIDLIVMGTSGEQAAEEFFSGNHTERVIEVAQCPVISVKENYTKGDFSKIVLGLSTEKDGSDNFLQAATYLKNFADTINASIEIVNIVDPGKSDKAEHERKLIDFATRFGLEQKSVTIVENDDKEAGLINFARERGAGFLAVFTHAEDGFFRIFRSSLSEDLSMSSDIPVLTINLHNI